MTDVQEGHKKGTTTVGIVCKDAVILAADKRATLGFLIANKDVDKIFEVTSNIGMTFAGSAADGQALAKLMKAEMRLYNLNTGLAPSLTVAASLTANVVLERAKSFIPYYVQLIMGGKDTNSFSLYSLDMGGSIIQEKKFTATGSGSPMAFGVLEDGYKDNMSSEEGVQLAFKAINSAIKRDIFTGEGVNVIVIDKNGYRKVNPEQVTTKSK
ncbi:MAG: archaeal proteasome endopeptidase complex subunit beta [DPANN group archaeon]|nr:archaeal proteasome endopeptidase complex subunit beta [DPANN group archaeon]